MLFRLFKPSQNSGLAKRLLIEKELVGVRHPLPLLLLGNDPLGFLTAMLYCAPFFFINPHDGVPWYSACVGNRPFIIVRSLLKDDTRPTFGDER